MSKLNVNPTRMELRRLKNRLKTATRGHKLLKDKSDEMIRQFMLYVRENKRLREEVEEELGDSLKSFMLARAVSSDAVIEEAIAMPSAKVTLETSSKNVMSVNVPVFTVTEGESKDLYPYSFASVTSELDSSISSLTELLPKLLKLAEVEKTCNMLADEIEKNRRRVNALEYVMIPQLEETIKYIVMKLDENGQYVPTGEAKIFYGGMYESVGCSPFNSGMFDAICELGSTQAVYCGHDHINDFCANYKGVCFIYSQCGGYETYTMGTNFGWPEEKWMQGVTITEILPDGSITVGRRFNRDYLKRPEQFNAEKQAYEESKRK